MDVETLRQFCLSLPAATEDVKWGHDLVFSVGGKMFCVCSLDPPFSCSFKTGDEEFEEWSNRDGFIPAPYMARAKWVLMNKPSAISKNHLTLMIRNSYEMVKKKLTKKCRLELGI